VAAITFVAEASVESHWSGAHRCRGARRRRCRPPPTRKPRQFGSC